MNFQIWFNKNGIDNSREVKKVSLRGAINGEATSVAIIEELPGRKLKRGFDKVK